MYERNKPIKLYPFLSYVADDKQRIISIDPLVSFGKPTIEKSGVSTAVLVDRVDAGELIEDIAADYSINKSDIEMAVMYEQAA
jgi:uncharacterized protein (DUF433 family)